MRILHLCAFYYPNKEGGAEIFAKELCERLAKENDVTMVTGKFSKELPNKEKIGGVDVVRIPMLMVQNLKLLTYMFSSVIEGWKRRKGVDVYHGTMAFSAGTAAVLLKKLTGKRAVVTIQGGDMGDYKENSGKFGGILKPLISWTLKNADVVHAVSKDLERKAKALGVKEVVVIPNGVDTEKFSRRGNKRKELGLEDKKVILTVSRLAPKNGIDTLIEAFGKVRGKIPEAELLVIGKGEDEEKLRKMAIEGVHFLEPVPHEQLADYYTAADVFCRPSRDEGFGIVFIEAMACGVVPVSTCVGGITDIITNWENGVLVKPDDSTELAENLEKLLLETNKRKELSENAVQDAKARFSWESIKRRTEEIYNEVGADAGK